MRVFLINLILAVFVFGAIVPVGHHAPVISVGMSIDGRIAASGGTFPDPTVKIWDLRTGEMLETLNFGNRYNVISVSLDGRYVAIGGDSKFIVLWNTSTRSPERVYAGHTKPITAITIDPMGRYVASGDESGTVKIWKVGGSGIYKNFFAHTGKVTDISFSNDSQFLASSGTDGTVVIWKGLYKFPIAKIKIGKVVTSVLVVGNSAVDGSATVVVGDVSGVLRFFRIEPEKTEEFKILVPYKVEKVKEVRAHVGVVWDITSSPDGGFMASCGNDGKVLVWDLEKMEIVGKMSWTGFPITSVSMTMDGRVMGSDTGGNLIVWDSSTGKAIRVIEGSPMVTDVSIEGSMVIAGYNDGTVKIFSKDGKLVKVLKNHKMGDVKVELTEFGLISAGSDGRMVAIDLETFKLKKILIGRGKPVCCMAKDEKGKRLAVVDEDGNLSVWNMENGLLDMYISTGEDVKAVGIFGDIVVVGDSRGYLKFWNVSTRRLDREINFKVPIERMDIDHSKNEVAVYCGDGYIRIMDLKTFEIVNSMRPISDSVKDLVFKDGKIYIAGGEDNIEVWKIDNMEPVPGIIVEKDSLTVVAAEGDRMVAGGYTGMIYVWDGREMIYSVGFSDGEYAVFKGGTLETSDGIESGLAVGIEMVVKKKTDIPICGSFSEGKRLAMEFKVSGDELIGAGIADNTVYIATRDGSVLVWSLKGGKIVNVYGVSSVDTTALKVGKDGLILGDRSGNVFVVDFNGNVKKIGRHYGRVRGVDWYGKYPVSVAMDDYLIVWKEKPIRIDVESAYSLHIEGRFAYVGGRDEGYVRVYDLETRKLIGKVKVHEDIVSALTVYKGGILSVGMDGVVALSHLETKEVKVLGRSLTNFTSLALNGDILIVGTAFGDVKIFDLKKEKEITERALWNYPVVSIVPYGNRFLVVGERGTVALVDLYGRKVAEIFVKGKGYVLYRYSGEVLSENLKVENVADLYVIDEEGRRKPISVNEICPVFALDLTE